MYIKPSTVLRNSYGAISALAHEKEEPIYITNKGEGDLVIMSIEAYERREEILRLRARLEMAETEQIAGGRTYSLAESKEQLDKIYG